MNPVDQPTLFWHCSNFQDLKSSAAVGCNLCRVLRQLPIHEASSHEDYVVYTDSSIALEHWHNVLVVVAELLLSSLLNPLLSFL